VRIATLIIGLLLGAILFIQSLLIAALSDAANTEHDGSDGATGLLMALLWLVACGLVIPAPRIAMLLFVASGIGGLAAAGPLDFPDLAYWGVVSLVLSAFAYLGYRGKRNHQIKERGKEDQMAQLLAHNQQMASTLQARTEWQRQQGWVAFNQQQKVPPPSP